MHVLRCLSSQNNRDALFFNASNHPHHFTLTSFRLYPRIGRAHLIYAILVAYDFSSFAASDLICRTEHPWFVLIDSL